MHDQDTGGVDLEIVAWRDDDERAFAFGREGISLNGVLNAHPSREPGEFGFLDRMLARIDQEHIDDGVREVELAAYAIEAFLEAIEMGEPYPLDRQAALDC